MKSAFNKEVLRSITGSWGRFLAILGIVALGCGFYAGLRMTGPDMRISADAWYDGTNLYDLRLLSSLGYSDDSVDYISQVEGVEAVMPARSTDVMATLNGEQYVMRVNTLPASAQNSVCADGCVVESDDASYLNRPVLKEGSWPAQAGECVLSDDRVMGTPIQVGDTVQVLYGSADLDGVLETRTYTVVGLVSDSSYVSSVSLGSTSLGSGTIQQFMYVSDASFSADCPYTQLFVKVAGADAQFAGSAAYGETVSTVADRLDADKDAIAARRLAEVKSDAQAQVDEGRADYDGQKGEADSALADAQSELDSALQTLNDSQASFDAGVAAIADARAQMDDARAQWQSGYDEWAQGAAAWEEKRAELVSQKEALQTQKGDLQMQLDAAQEQLNQLEASKAALEALIAQTTDPVVKAQLEAQLAQVEQGIASAKTGIAQLEAGLKDVQNGIDEIDTALVENDATISEAKAALDAAKQEIDGNQVQLDEKQAELDSVSAQLQSGWAEYYSSLATYNSSKTETLDALADAAQLLDTAQADIDAVESPSIYVLDRTKNLGVESFKSDSERIDNIASVFPFIFFLVAALVALTTMTRMVDEERELIGTYKALGYSRARITSKYLLYAAVASITGSVIGILILSQVLPWTIANAYGIIYNVPQRPLPLTIDAGLALLAAGMGVGVTLLATVAAAMATLHEQPASLMLPRAPKAGRRILLERIAPLWRKLSFSWKVSLRNLFRYKKRFWMTVIGIAGCTALLLTGFGLHNAIWDIIDKQYGELVHYNVVVGMKEGSTTTDLDSVKEYLSTEGETGTMTLAQNENMQVGSATHDSMGVTACVAQDASAMSGLLTMRDRTTQAPLAFDDDSAILTEKLAKTLGVSAGDTFTLYDQDEIGNAIGDGYTLTCTGVMENYVGNGLYLGKNAYANATGIDPPFTSLYAQCTTDSAIRATMTENLHAMGNVDTVAYNDETIDSYEKMLSSVNTIVVVLVVSAAALDFIVLYNLTNINITERRREIASLKVLGFTPREVHAYIYREIVLLTLLGALLGLLLGVWMEGFVVVTAEVDYVMFGREIHALSYLLAFLFTMVFTFLVLLTMKKKLDRIDMVESLKSVD